MYQRAQLTYAKASRCCKQMLPGTLVMSSVVLHTTGTVNVITQRPAQRHSAKRAQVPWSVWLNGKNWSLATRTLLRYSTTKRSYVTRRTIGLQLDWNCEQKSRCHPRLTGRTKSPLMSRRKLTAAKQWRQQSGILLQLTSCFHTR